jgi:hypothetical protein
MKERAVLHGSLRSFGSVRSQSTVAKYLSERGKPFPARAVEECNMYGRRDYVPSAFH